MSKTNCRYCGDTGIVMHRVMEQLDGGPHGSTTYYTSVEGECSYCSEPRRIEKLEIQVEELVRTVRILTIKLADALDIDLQNYPRSTAPVAGEEEIPF